MQQDPSKQGYNNYGNDFVNQYPPMNQPQMGMGNAYPPNNAPPAYSQYPQQQSYYQPPGAPYPVQTPIYQPPGTVLVPAYRPVWNNALLTPITSALKTFLLFSGIAFLIWGILDVGLEVGILFNSYSTYYRGLWAGGYLIGTGIAILVASCRPSYNLHALIRVFAVALVLNLLGLILSIVNLVTSDSCYTSYWYYCDNELATNLKRAILAVFALSTVHVIVSIVVVSNARKRAISPVAPIVTSS